MSESRPASSIAAVTFVPRTTSTSAPRSTRSRRASASSFRSGSYDDLAAGALQAVDAALLELVGDQAPSCDQRPFKSGA